MIDKLENFKHKGFRSGFAAIIGTPNVGKSTLLNRILGEKISITSKKPQTTRNRILGIHHRPSSQIIFVDTPGMHKPRGKLNEIIVETAVSTMADVDIILIVVDLSGYDKESEEFVVRKLKKENRPVVLALNKTDLVKGEKILRLIDKWSRIYPFKSIVPVSAKHGNQVDELLAVMEQLLPEGPPLFPEESLTDQPERFIVAEMIREKVFRLTGQEIPYSTAVTIDTFSEEKKGALVKIEAVIHVERNSQKGMVIGKKGSKLKQIGQDARKEIERMLQAKVFLKLFVRVQENWSSDTKALRKLGY
ncbi:MAG: GTPase Era [Deltaproteobacteria bacterium]|nr:GTPase Era [Deltaproteobacteria bacterium]